MEWWNDRIVEWWGYPGRQELALFVRQVPPNWVCLYSTAHSSPLVARPWGLVPPGTAGNWLDDSCFRFQIVNHKSSIMNQSVPLITAVLHESCRNSVPARCRHAAQPFVPKGIRNLSLAGRFTFSTVAQTRSFVLPTTASFTTEGTEATSRPRCARPQPKGIESFRPQKV